MSPHDSNPAPQRIEVDLSSILIPPARTALAQVTHTPECGIVHKQAETAIDSLRIRIGPFAWASINFVVGSCLIAFFCTLFVSENLHFRRRAHLPDNIVYSKPNLDSTGSGFKMEMSQLAPGVQLDRSPVTGFGGLEAVSNPTPLFSSALSVGADQNSSLSPNLGRFAENGSVNNSSSARSINVAQNGVSRSTASKSTTSSPSQRSISVRSSATRLTRHLSKQTLSTQTRGLTGRQSLRSLAKGAGKSTAARSIPQTNGSLKSGNQQLQRHGAENQTAVARTQMPMRSMGQGNVAPQIHGSTNPMQMEAGSLAQPGIGGVTGNGLGGAGHHGAHGRR